MVRFVVVYCFITYHKCIYIYVCIHIFTYTWFMFFVMLYHVMYNVYNYMYTYIYIYTVYTYIYEFVLLQFELPIRLRGSESRYGRFFFFSRPIRFQFSDRQSLRNLHRKPMGFCQKIPRGMQMMLCLVWLVHFFNCEKSPRINPLTRFERPSILLGSQRVGFFL